MAYDFDYFVIGGGSGGVRSARIAATLGARVGIAESTHFGGTCVNVGCIPKKILSYAADYGTGVEQARNYGWSGNMTFDWATLKENKDKEIARLSGIYRNILDINKVTVFDGYAGLKDDHTIVVNENEITAERISIAVGARPQLPDIKGAEFAKTSDDMFALSELPQRIVILGAGYIGLEFAHILHGLGRDVTLVHRGKHLLRGFDIDVQDHVLDQMQKAGIKIICGKNTQELTENAVLLDDGTVIETDLILAATGRVPNTEKLLLENAKVEKDKKGRIIVTPEFVTNVPHIFAIGDVTDTPNLTPVAIAQGHALAERLFGGKIRHVNMNNIPTAVFSSPEIGTVGMTEQQAAKNGEDYTVYATTFRPLRHTITGLDVKVMMKLVVCNNTDRILGFHMCGDGAGEMVQMAAIAMNAGVTRDAFETTLPVHPTTAEEWVFLKAVTIPHSPETLAERG